jgi:hypothetical protein
MPRSPVLNPTNKQIIQLSAQAIVRNMSSSMSCAARGWRTRLDASSNPQRGGWIFSLRA